MQFFKKLSVFVVVALLLQLIPPFALQGTDKVEALGASGPLPQAFNPTSTTSGVGIKPDLEVIFDETIEKSDTSKRILIKKESDNSEVYSFLVSSNSVKINGAVLKIELSNTQVLAYDTTYYIEIPDNAIRSATTQNPYTGNVGNPSSWKFTTTSISDNTSPSITAVSYKACEIVASSGASGVCSAITDTNAVPSNASIDLQFSKQVQLGSGNVTISSSSDTRNISVSSAEITGAGSSVITIKPSMPLLPNTTYTLSISRDNFKDTSNQRMSSNQTFRFTTKTDSVLISALSPENNSSNVDKDAQSSFSISLTFNQNVLPVVSKKIYVYRVNDNSLVTSFDVRNSTNQNGGNTFTYNFNRGLLQAGTQYYIRVDSGSYVSSTTGYEIYRGITSTNGWTFTTKAAADNVAPTIINNGYKPAHGSTNVSRNEKIVLEFSENVFPNNGTINIYAYNSGTLYRQIPVSSSRITGGGTNQITIDPHAAQPGEAVKSFDSNTRYYVTISKGAFRDAANNTFAGFTNKNSYNFTVGTMNDSKPLLESISPENGSDVVRANGATFTATFNEAVQLVGNNGAYIQSASNNTTIALHAAVDGSDNKKVHFTPASPLAENHSYYIVIPSNYITDVDGNYYVGILNTYQWAFKTLGGDRTAPSIIRAEVNGTKLRLVYNELLDSSVTPAIGSFYVTVDGKLRNISEVKIENNAVILTLHSSVSSNQHVLVSYTKPSTGLVRDITGNQAASYSNQAVTYGTLNTLPVVKSSSYSGRSITLQFSEPLMKVNSSAYLQFGVRVNGTANTVTGLTQTDNTIVLTVSNSISNNRSVVVSYAKGSFPLKGYAGDVANFSHTIGSGSSGSISGPIVQSATVSGNKLYITYDRALAAVSAPSVTQYTVRVNGNSRSVTGVQLNGRVVTLTLASSVASTNTVTLSYSESRNSLLDSNGVYAPSITGLNVSVDDEQSESPIALRAIIAKGDKITLTFNKELDSSYVPNTSQFYVLINGDNWRISNIKVSGKEVVITLSSPINIGASGSVSYYTTSDTLRSSDGELVSMFTNEKITNQTTVLDVLSDDYSSLANGVVIKTSAATKVSDRSPSGKIASKYNIDYSKLITAINALANANITNAEIRFEVPSSESSAIVSFPLIALETAASKGKFTFVVKHGDMFYEIPAASIDITKASRLNSGTASNNELVVKMESGSSSKTSSLESSIKTSGATIIGVPYVYEAAIVGPTGSSDVPFIGNVVRKVKLSRSITKDNTSAVYYDEIAKNISGVPTNFNDVSGGTEIVFFRPGNSAYAIVTSSKSYTDTSSHWANHSILTLSRKFIVDGHSSTLFNPKTNITRGEFATYLVKGLGLQANKQAAKQFKDVNSESMLGGYIGAAVNAGIVAGVSANEFKPNSYITRQDMAIMMMRVVKYTNMNVSLTSDFDGYLRGYSDANKVSAYAKPQMAQAIQLGIIAGTTSSTLSPLANATRAEGITMIERVLIKAGYLQK